MGKKASAIALRVKCTRGWDANWFAKKRDFAKNLLQDQFIRKYVLARMPHADISRIIIERTPNKVYLVLCTAKPGVAIAKSGVEVEKLSVELKRIYEKDVQIKIVGIKRPELDAYLVAKSVAQQISSRSSYKKAIRYAVMNAMRLGAQGAKIRVSGRLNGAEIALSEEYKEGRLPLNTFRADVDYALAEAHTTYGTIGVKVFIFTKEVYGKRDFSLPSADGKKQLTSRHDDQLSAADNRLTAKP